MKEEIKQADKGLKKPSISNHQKLHSKHDEDVEVDSIATCRICLERNGEDDKDLISPCMCKGTQQFVHRSCLDNWRSVIEGFAFSHCSTCKAQFHLRVIDLQQKNKIKFRLFVARDIILIFLAIQILIGIIGGVAFLADKRGSFRNSFDDRFLSKHPIPFYYCGLLSFLGFAWVIGTILHCCRCCNGNTGTGGTTFCFLPVDGGGLGSGDGGEGFVVVFVFLVILFVIIGIVYALFATTVIFQSIWQRHYHILMKRQLTKEYVVEDLNGCYTPAKLDSEHMERLKTLKLFEEGR